MGRRGGLQREGGLARAGGMAPSTNVTSSSCVCVTPAGVAGSTVAVEVSTNGVDFTSSGVQYSYRSVVRVSSVQPASGPESGSTSVTVVGANFVDSRKYAYTSVFLVRFLCAWVPRLTKVCLVHFSAWVS